VNAVFDKSVVHADHFFIFAIHEVFLDEVAIVAYFTSTYETGCYFEMVRTFLKHFPNLSVMRLHEIGHLLMQFIFNELHQKPDVNAKLILIVF